MSAVDLTMVVYLVDTVTGAIDVRAGFADVWPQLTAMGLSDDGHRPAAGAA